ncbi:MAG: hypothetical protein HY033_08675 [Ignavibacteriae bacterium]|nr:hypothetical protein [Ignavibacteria bacterium]MBI3364967.1 hypothetical protein [Ignavibacteriota bacterium]
MPIFALLLPLCAIRCDAQAQTLWVSVSDNQGAAIMMYFGNNNRATYGIDNDLGECEGPPLSPGLDVRWFSRRKDISYGLGLLNRDFIPCPINEERKDTFILLISQPDKNPASWVIEWQKEDELRAEADSMFLVIRGDTVRKIDMFKSNFVRLTNEDGFQKIYIYTYGGCPRLHSLEGRVTRPNFASLTSPAAVSSSAPNPFLKNDSPLHLGGCKKICVDTKRDALQNIVRCSLQ